MLKKVDFTIYNGFTIVELIIVFGILALLAAVLVFFLNPAEIQKQARDSQRFKDLSNVQTAVEGYINDNPALNLNLSASSFGGNPNCDTGWLGLPVCNYLNILPTDPKNTTGVLIADANGSTIIQDAYYYVRISNEGYNICSYLESNVNSYKLTSDGISDNLYNVYSNTSVPCP